MSSPGDLAECEPAPDAVPPEAMEGAPPDDSEPQWIVWETAGAQHEWAAAELTSLPAMA